MSATNNELILGRDLMFNIQKSDLVATPGGDMELSKYRYCLAQAIFSRLNTRQGELALHPLYGSLLSTMIGEINNEDNREKIRLFVIETLSQEPRIDTINEVTITMVSDEVNTVRIYVYVTSIVYTTPGTPTGAPIELNLTYDYYLLYGGVKQVSID